MRRCAWSVGRVMGSPSRAQATGRSRRPGVAGVGSGSATAGGSDRPFLRRERGHARGVRRRERATRAPPHVRSLACRRERWTSRCVSSGRWPGQRVARISARRSRTRHRGQQTQCTHTCACVAHTRACTHARRLRCTLGMALRPRARVLSRGQESAHGASRRVGQESWGSCTGIRCHAPQEHRAHGVGSTNSPVRCASGEAINLTVNGRE